MKGSKNAPANSKPKKNDGVLFFSGGILKMSRTGGDCIIRKHRKKMAIADVK